ncbi:CHASE domain [Sesbania bispinosa]|nr:CHASE domain [Sesbania bispinosa]
MDADTKVRRKEVLGSLCDQRARMLQDQFSVSVNHVHALASLFQLSITTENPSAIDQETFAEYTARTAFERPLLSGVAYAQRVVNSEREKFEKQHGWVYKDNGKESLPRLLGSHHLGVVLTFPVYKSKLPPKPTTEERIKATAGYVGGSFDVESLVENLLGQLAGNQAILVKVYDVTNSTDPLIMYGNQYEEGDMSLLHEIGYILYGAGNHIVKVEDDFHEMQELKVRAESS